MRIFLYITSLLLFSCTAEIQAQVFWTETFGSGPKNTSIDGLDTGNGPWTESAIGTQGTKANSWFASKQECGNDAGECGSTCASDASLHVGSVSAGFCSGGDCGAAYLAASTSKTEKEAISPHISTDGYGDITISFNYIGFGEGTHDVASWSYSCDGGSTWTFVTNLTTNCCNSSGSAVSCTAGICGLLGCQGRWTAYSYALPSCADDITYFKIKFHWKNDNDNNGNDPSFAVDDITLSYSVLPVELVSFTAEEITDGYNVQWTTQTETNSNYFEVERSFDGEQFISAGKVSAAGNSLQEKSYQFTDKYLFTGTRYYRLKQVDADASFRYSNIISITSAYQQNYFVQQTPDEIVLTSQIFHTPGLQFELITLAGNIVQQPVSEYNGNTYALNLSTLPSGMYLLLVKDKTGTALLHHKFIKN